MTSSGSRVGAWDYLRWGVIFPMIRNEELIAAKMIVYPGESHEYITFISLEAYYALKSWMKFSENSGELINDDESWLMRNLWNSLMPAEN